LAGSPPPGDHMHHMSNFGSLSPKDDSHRVCWNPTTGSGDDDEMQKGYL